MAGVAQMWHGLFRFNDVFCAVVALAGITLILCAGFTFVLINFVLK
jgi:hypothetical protein